MPVSNVAELAYLIVRSAHEIVIDECGNRPATKDEWEYAANLALYEEIPATPRDLFYLSRSDITLPMMEHPDDEHNANRVNLKIYERILGEYLQYDHYIDRDLSGPVSVVVGVSKREGLNLRGFNAVRESNL